jgi:MscS family membrane protein
MKKRTYLSQERDPMNRMLRFTNIALVFTFSFLFLGAQLHAAENQVQQKPTPGIVLQTGNDVIKITPSQKLLASGKDANKKIDVVTQEFTGVLGDWVAERIYLDITWLKLIYCMMLFGCVIILERIIKFILGKKLHRMFDANMHMKTLALLIDAQRGPLSLFILSYGALWSFSPILSQFRPVKDLQFIPLVAGKAADIAGYFAILWYLYRLAIFFENYLKDRAYRSDSNLGDMFVPFLGKSLRFLIIVVGFAVILHRLTGLNFGPLIASLGIGGVAIAFAAKESIANILGSLTIIFDKPFTVGDRIVIDNYDGVVEQVGFRSTRIRSLTGSLVSIPNEKVINMPLENIGKRPHIRWSTNITIAYDTPPAKVEKAVTIIKDILDNHEGMKPDFPPRVYFNDFNSTSLNIMVLAWYHPAEYWQYMDWLQQTCFKILNAFEAEEIDFAFPTQTVYLAGDNKRELAIKMMKNSENS